MLRPLIVALPIVFLPVVAAWSAETTLTRQQVQALTIAKAKQMGIDLSQYRPPLVDWNGEKWTVMIPHEPRKGVGVGSGVADDCYEGSVNAKGDDVKIWPCG
jgi:hypothetical protein